MFLKYILLNIMLDGFFGLLEFIFDMLKYFVVTRTNRKPQLFM